MHEAYAALSGRDFQYVVWGKFLSVVISSSKTSSLASTLIEFIFRCACDETYPQESWTEIFQGWLSRNLL